MKANINQLAQGWYEAMKEAKKSDWSDISLRFLNMLQGQGKLSWLGRIREEVKRLENQALGVTQVKVTTAHKLEEKELSKLVSELLGKDKAQLSVVEDQSILGGVVIETEDQRWDLSTRNRLNQLQEKLLNK